MMIRMLTNKLAIKMLNMGFGFQWIRTDILNPKHKTVTTKSCDNISIGDDWFIKINMAAMAPIQLCAIIAIIA